MKNKILKILNDFGREDIHILGDIPDNKLETATARYHIDENDTILSLIDATVFGSAKVGMAIGLKGIYFKSDRGTPERKNFFSWEELKGKKIKKGSWLCVEIAPGTEFNLSGAGISVNTFIDLLNNIIQVVSETNYSQPFVSETNYSQSVVSETLSESEYQNIIPTLIALSIVADGIIDDSELDTAFIIIENDELIQDKSKAFKELNFQVNDLLQKKENSHVLFRLKIAELISKVSEIYNSNEKEKILIILDGMYESASEEGKEATDLIRTKIQDKLLCTT